MDAFVTKLFNYVPAKWQPYVALLLLVLYVAAKVRRHAESAQLAAAKAASAKDVAAAAPAKASVFNKMSQVGNLFLNLVC